MAYFIYLTPWAADDYNYGADNIFSLTKILSDEYIQYFSWTGRSIAHIIARLLLQFPEVHTFLTPLIFCSLILIIHILAYGMTWKEHLSASKIFLIFALLWIGIPSFGTVFFWKTGAANYCYTLFFASVFLIPYRFLLDAPDYSPSKTIRLLFFFSGILAGWSNENLGCVIFLLALCSVLLQYKKNKKIPLWALFGIAGAVLGWFILMLAPGNYVRLQHPMFASFLALPLWARMVENLFSLFSTQVNYLFLFYLLLIFSFFYRKFTKISLLFLSASLLSLSALLFSAPSPDRALTPSAFFICVVSYLCILSYNKYTYMMYIAIFTYTTFSIVDNIYIFEQNNIMQQERRSIINASKDKNIIVKKYINSNKYFFIGSEIEDISDDSQSWVNKAIANKLSLNSIVIEKELPHKNNTIRTNINSKKVYYIEKNNTLKGFFRYLTRILHGNFDDTLVDNVFLKLFFRRSFSEENIAYTENREANSFYYILLDDGLLHKKYY